MLKILSLVSSLIFLCAKPAVLFHEQKQNKALQTGWYHISDKKNNYPRQLDKSREAFYLNPSPIITAKQITTIDLIETGSAGYLLMKFDAPGTKAWAEATGGSIGGKLAFVIKDQLIYTPQIDAQITSGISALNRGIYNKAELEAFKKLILLEKR